MSGSSKLEEITLISKYYPVANYSYPRKNSTINQDTEDVVNRISLNSQSSAPGLIEDKSDSEASGDEDYTYRTSELWDNYWQGGYEVRKREAAFIHPKKQYPALIPSPQRRQKRTSENPPPPPSKDESPCPPTWPLPRTERRIRKAAATYSAFPKPSTIPPKPRPAPSSPSWTTSRSKQKPPERPPRPNDELLTPCIRQMSPLKASFFTPDYSERGQTQNSLQPPPISPISPLTPLPPLMRPVPASLEDRAAITHRPSTSLDHRSPPPEPKMTLYAVQNQSATNLTGPPPKVKPSRLARIKTKSTPHMYNLLRPIQPPQISFFEDDSDTEESPSRSFFRFHKRLGSDDRRGGHRRTGSQDEKKRRQRSSTVPPTPLSAEFSLVGDGDGADPTILSPDKVKRKRQGAVFGLVLGRKSR